MGKHPRSPIRLKGSQKQARGSVPRAQRHLPLLFRQRRRAQENTRSSFDQEQKKNLSKERQCVLEIRQSSRL